MLFTEDSITVGIAALSLIIAILSLFNSRKAVAIAKADYDEKKLSIKPYLIDSFTFVQSNNEYCFFAISYTNQSSSPQSFQKLELIIEFVDSNGIHSKASTGPCNDVHPSSVQPSYEKLKTPLNLQPKETISGWLTFKIPKTCSQKLDIERYTVQGITADGQNVNAESIILRHVENEK